MSKDPIYRVIFIQNGKQYEIYSRFLTEESLMGFIELEDLIFSDAKNSIVVDPGEEKLKNEFKDVRRCYIPMHTILRIDEVHQEGIASIKDCADKISNVSHFPRTTIPTTSESKE